jgi:hypothetical protein
MIVHALQEAKIVYIVIIKSVDSMMRNGVARCRSGILPSNSTALTRPAIHIRRQYVICVQH